MFLMIKIPEPHGLRGGPLTRADYDALSARWIDRDTADRQFIRRVDCAAGAAIVGRKGRSGDYSGFLIPYVLPGDDHVRDFRLRRDHPDMESGKPRAKYVSPPGRSNMLYFPIGTDPDWLTDTSLPVTVTEGEFKALALTRAAMYGRPEGAKPRFVAVGLGGVWNWRGVIGKTNDAEGNRVDVRGPIADLSRIVWDDRRVLIIFDADLEGNDSVAAARSQLTKELRARAAQISWFHWPEDRPENAKGIDDLIHAIGPDKALALIEAALSVPIGPPNLIAFHFADTGNADRLVALHGADFRYCFAFRKWLIWNGTRWVLDETAQALKRAKQTMIDFLRQAVDAKNGAAESFARGSLDAKRLNAMLTLAQPELPITIRELDRDPSPLNFTNGLRPHRRSDLITKIVRFPYRPEAKCPRFRSFVSEIMGNSEELIGYLKASLGYSATGDVSEKVVHVAHGCGDNGKTTLFSFVRDLIRDYATTIGLDLLTTWERSNNADAARANLRGVRFVISSETEEGQRLSAARLKRICQGPGSEIEACRKYENPIVFFESHKLWIEANHKPQLPASDEATWNRLRLIPFTVVFPKDKQDRKLQAKLMQEAEGVLSWLVEGAKEWYAKGLPESSAVDVATKAWREELDRLGAYLDEHTEKAKDAQAWLLNKTLYEAYKSWCETNGEPSLSHIRFAKQMEAMGYVKERKDQGNIWRGIRFRRL